MKNSREKNIFFNYQDLCPEVSAAKDLDNLKKIILFSLVLNRNTWAPPSILKRRSNYCTAKLQSRSVLNGIESLKIFKQIFRQSILYGSGQTRSSEYRYTVFALISSNPSKA